MAQILLSLHCTPETVSPSRSSAAALLSTGALVMVVHVCVSECWGGGGLSLPSSLKASERAALSDQQSPSHTLLYTSIPLQKKQRLLKTCQRPRRYEQANIKKG